MHKKSWWRNKTDKLNSKRSFFWVFFSLFLVSGSAALGLLIYKHKKQQNQNSDKYTIVALVQSCTQREHLKNVYLAELLGLSIDQPTNLYNFSISKAYKKLSECHLIKEAVIKKISPGTVFVKYSMREPVAYIGDFTNTAIDNEGYLFPFKPFFSPKTLPTITLGQKVYDEVRSEKLWGYRIFNKKLNLAHTLVAQLQKNQGVFVEQVDLSRMHEESCGKREIIVKVRAVTGRAIYLRLNTNKYFDSITRIQQVASLLQQNVSVLDLRIDNLLLLK